MNNKYKYVIYDSNGLVSYNSRFSYDTYNITESIARAHLKIGKLAGYDYHHFSVI